MMRAAVFMNNGMGDGINCLVLSNNLHLNGWKVDTYQNAIGSMQNWFPHLPVQNHPKVEELPRILESYDWFFVVQNEKDEFIRRLIQEGKRRFPERIKVIYLYPSKNIVNEPYYTDCLTNPSLPVAENMRLICEKILHLPKLTKSNGFIPPTGLIPRKYKKRIAVHPTSADPARNWPKEKFIKLLTLLKNEGFNSVLIPGMKEGWEGLGFDVALFPTLDLLARYLYESDFFIGNDSGLGHLSSALGLPTLTFCRRKAWAHMWAPSFHKNIVLTPYSWIPNIRGFRFRDENWERLVSVSMAKRAFAKLTKS